MRTTLIIPFEFVASHSLAEFEKPHPHLWKFEARMTGELLEGRIVDLASLGKSIEDYISPYRDTYLNEAKKLPENAAQFPTCETLGAAFFALFDSEVLLPYRAKNQSLTLLSMKVSLCDLNGVSMGAALLER